IPGSAHIVPDGEAIRSLGAWIGNKTEAVEPWAKVVAAVERSLERWSQRKPSLHGRKLIVGMEVAGRTQFLTKAQTMPDHVEKRLTKIMINFIWDGATHPPVARDLLYKPVAD
ncbi:hypothetical protein OH77DRAFT_1378461, partial [Trametes cingulata]